MRRTIRLVLFSLWALGLTAPVAATAQETPPDPNAGEPNVPPVVAVSEISTEAQKELQALKALDSRAGDTELDERLTKDLERLANAIDAQFERAAVTHERDPGRRELDSLASGWTDLADEISSLLAELDSEVAELEADLTGLEERVGLWKRTRTSAREDSVPRSVLDAVSSVLDAAQSTQRKVERARNRSLSLKTRLVGLQAKIVSGVGRVDAAREELVGDLLGRQHAPIWTLRPADTDLAEELARMRDSALATGNAVANYAARRWPRLLLHLLGIVGLFATIRWARLRVAARQPEGTEVSRALSHPVAAAVTLGLALTPGIHPSAPAEIWLLGILLAIPSWVVVLRAMLPDGLHGVLYALAVLTLLDSIRDYVQPIEALARSLLVLNAVLVAAVVYWIRRPSRLEGLPAAAAESRWLRAVGIYLQIVFWSLVVGAIAGVFGFSNLADMLVRVSIRGSYVGLVFVAGVRIAEGIVEALVLAAAFDRLRMVRRYPQRFLRGTRRVFRLVAGGFWSYIILLALGLFGPLVGIVGGALTASVGYGALQISLGGVLAFVAALWGSWLLGRVTSFVLDQEVFTRVSLPSGVPFALATFTRYAILVFGFLVAIAMLGFPLQSLTLVISALGVGIGFGLQNLVNNFVSGIILLFERPIRVGDRLQIDDLLGEVTSIGIRASRVRTFDGADVIVPNGELIAGRVINWTLADRRRRVILPIGVKYGTDPERVLEILLRVGSQHPDVMEEPAPEALFRAFGESSLDFELRVWTQSDRGWLPVQSDLAVATNAALAAAGIEIPFPQRDLHLRSVEPELRAGVFTAPPDAPRPPATRATPRAVSSEPPSSDGDHE